MVMVKDAIKIDHVAHSMLTNFTTPRDSEYCCKRCGVKFIPPEWFFYGLCNGCFDEFDSQKMEGRFAKLFANKDIKHYENAEAWIVANPVNK